ncbi:COP9 signalosome catalytic subunit rri1 [Malassezia vespertilionis]|uniref:COP9 signalosome catalytic subunit rri1 n=1 Tax=Malassezia vespertilionis TaxID=2020962 RepID=UPI0024B23F3E|nr:COP9 signalosome catalytic subunit rri1 [Malassezia vespertilionis]WFD06332.1 COP9 signalosome catalytic subunit rri1 [Malassezia vespertilionis]
MASAETARRTFEVLNDVISLDDEAREIYEYDPQAYQDMLRHAPWRSDATFFRRVRISVVALMKMVLHARAGGNLEVMGLMQGAVRPESHSFYIMDAFALPVHGTETRVNAQNEAYEYMVSYMEGCNRVSLPQNAVGWYHSHPGYRCWLSGIDVQTQETNQQQDPFVAVVIDPRHTMTMGRVDIGAFRTYPRDYRAEHGSNAERTSLPAGKVADYGAHADKYYALDVQLFTTKAMRPVFELLWNEYWASTLETSPSLLQRSLDVQQTAMLVERLRASAAGIAGAGMLPGSSQFAHTARNAPSAQGSEVEQLVEKLQRRRLKQPLAQIAQDADQQAANARHECLREVVKSALFGTAKPAWPQGT